MQDSELTQTLSFGLTIQEDSSENLRDGCLEARRVRNETNRLDKEGWDWDDIHDTVVDNANHVKNTTQLLVQKALGEVETYLDHKDDTDRDWGRPYPYIDGTYPMRMNHNEGYALTIDEETGDVQFRVSWKTRNFVRGVLRGSPDHLQRVKTALNSDAWRVGIAELVYKHNEWRLHVTVTHKHKQIGSPDAADTVVGVDINEDCIALAAMTREGDLRDSVVFEYPDIKRVRHEFFTKRKRMQSVGQTAMDSVVQTEERDFVHDQLHKVSRDVVDWLSQFTNPVIVFEDLKDMRDSIDYGTRMNRRLHSLPFAALRDMVTYKAAWNEIPSTDVDPKYTSQRCPRTECLHIEQANRNKKRFKCKECAFQDHSDRKAAVCVCQEWFKKINEDVPSLETLPRVWKVRRAASGLCEEADAHGPNLGSGVTDAGSAQDSQSQARAQLKTVASTTD